MLSSLGDIKEHAVSLKKKAVGDALQNRQGRSKNSKKMFLSPIPRPRTASSIYAPSTRKQES